MKCYETTVENLSMVSLISGLGLLTASAILMDRSQAAKLAFVLSLFSLGATIKSLMYCCRSGDFIDRNDMSRSEEEIDKAKLCMVTSFFCQGVALIVAAECSGVFANSK